MPETPLDRLPAKTRSVAEEMLEEGEEVLAVFPGKSKQGMAVTDRRVLVIKAGMLSGAGMGAKAAGYTFDLIEAINVYTGRKVCAIELVVPHIGPVPRTDLRAAYQRANWLPCELEVGNSPLIGELRTFVLSRGRSRSARAALSGDGDSAGAS